MNDKLCAPYDRILRVTEETAGQIDTRDFMVKSTAFREDTLTIAADSSSLSPGLRDLGTHERIERCPHFRRQCGNRQQRSDAK